MQMPSVGHSSTQCLNDNQILSLQKELLDVRSDMKVLKERIYGLEKALLQISAPIEAVSILEAAEQRILNCILEGESVNNVRYYLSLQHVAEDDEENTLPTL